jgi:hypothetical protein
MGDLEEAVEHIPVFALLVGAMGYVENFTELIRRIVRRVKHDPLHVAGLDVLITQSRENHLVEFAAMRAFEARDFNDHYWGLV